MVGEEDSGASSHPLKRVVSCAAISMSVSTAPMNLTMKTGTRQRLMEQMVAEFSLDTARAIVRAIADDTGMTCEQAADIILDAWKRSKENIPAEMERDMLCFERIMMYP